MGLDEFIAPANSLETIPQKNALETNYIRKNRVQGDKRLMLFNVHEMNFRRKRSMTRIGGDKSKRMAAVCLNFEDNVYKRIL